MNRISICGVVIIAVAMSGCGAQMVSTRGNASSKYAPINEKDANGGVIKYLNDGAAFVVQQRRDDAYKQMYNYCNGKYKIVKEGPQAEGGYAYTQSGQTENPFNAVTTFGTSQYWYIWFECEKK